MSSIVILAMHGAPPNDFPAREMAEFFALHGRLEHAAGPERELLERRHVAGATPNAFLKARENAASDS